MSRRIEVRLQSFTELEGERRDAWIVDEEAAGVGGGGWEAGGGAEESELCEFAGGFGGSGSLCGTVSV